MLAVAAQSSSIGVVSALQRWGDRVHLVGLPYDREVFSGREVVAMILQGSPNFMGNPTSVMVRTDRVLAAQPFYDSRAEHADTDAFFRVLVDTDFGFVHQVLTYARKQGYARWERSQRIGTLFAEHTLFVVRYGRAVLEDSAYETTLRAALRSYLRYHLKQSVRPSRLVDREFLDFHTRAAENLLRDGAANPDVVRTATFVRNLLRRRALGRIVNPLGSRRPDPGVTRKQRRRLVEPPP